MYCIKEIPWHQDVDKPIDKSSEQYALWESMRKISWLLNYRCTTAHSAKLLSVAMFALKTVYYDEKAFNGYRDTERDEIEAIIRLMGDDIDIWKLPEKYLDFEQVDDHV